MFCDAYLKILKFKIYFENCKKVNRENIRKRESIIHELPKKVYELQNNLYFTFLNSLIKRVLINLS